MKLYFSLILCFLLSIVISCDNKQQSEKIKISGAFALYPMVVRWAEEFKVLHPNVNFDISCSGAGKGMTDVLTGLVDIGMVSREISKEEIKNGAFSIASVRDAVVPVVNVDNPNLKDIVSIGLKKEVAKRLWNGKFRTWGSVLKTSNKTPVHVFTRSDACGAAETWAAWFGSTQEDLKATAIFGDPGIANAVQKDKLGVGYSNISYVYSLKTRKPYTGLVIFPLDLNGNGKIDKEENFYDTLESLVAAISDGRYPSPPARNLYLVTKKKPINPILIIFLKYVLSEGQRYVAKTGYISLGKKKLCQELAKLN
ncbi:MAG: substrate-binding domain-containing protein [Bacteroidales bacterium OttesenSCG-928-I14]|jgi:phosphate transport system substrate-binding protein|nr:substrate-binding domain-containing protein [Bacteroidales bacterium OttesenSCG-928-I14]